MRAVHVVLFIELYKVDPTYHVGVTVQMKSTQLVGAFIWSCSLDRTSLICLNVRLIFDSLQPFRREAYRGQRSILATKKSTALLYQVNSFLFN